MIVAYADPPYPGMARKHYRRDPSGIVAREVNHAVLIGHLNESYPDGWALSTSSVALPYVLSLCPADVRIAAWVKTGWLPYRVGVNPAYTWEPVIWRGGRTKRPRNEATVRDAFCGAIPLRTGTHGAKPVVFCEWLFQLLGLQRGDTLIDLFPGSGVVGDTWARLTAEWGDSDCAARPTG